MINVTTSKTKFQLIGCVFKHTLSTLEVLSELFFSLYFATKTIPAHIRMENAINKMIIKSDFAWNMANSHRRISLVFRDKTLLLLLLIDSRKAKVIRLKKNQLCEFLKRTLHSSTIHLVLLTNRQTSKRDKHFRIQILYPLKQLRNEFYINAPFIAFFLSQFQLNLFPKIWQ